MSKIDNLHEKLYRVPSPKDFLFRELITVLEHYGCIYYEQKGGSSHKYFVYTLASGEEFRLSIARPHPDKGLKPYQFKAIKEFMHETGI